MQQNVQREDETFNRLAPRIRGLVNDVLDERLGLQEFVGIESVLRDGQHETAVEVRNVNVLN